MEQPHHVDSNESTNNNQPSSNVTMIDIPTPLSERRKTQVSNYLVTKDFKTDFAAKLNHLRQRELNLPANDLNHLTTATTKLINTNHDRNDYSVISSSKTRFTNPFCDQNSLKEEVETEDNSSIHSSIRKGVLSCDLSSVRASASVSASASEDTEEQSARYEVIRKLADQLAERIEENDHLLYELGVVRSNNARLKSIEMDQSDELTCLQQRILQLQSDIVNSNNNHEDNPHPNQSVSDSKKFNQSTQNHLTTIITHDSFTKSLRSKLNHVRNTLRQLQINLSPSNHGSRLRSNRHSWPYNQPKSAWAVSPSIQNRPTTEENNLDFLNKIHQLEVELFQCHEARIDTSITLEALIYSIDKELEEDTIIKAIEEQSSLTKESDTESITTILTEDVDQKRGDCSVVTNLVEEENQQSKTIQRKMSHATISPTSENLHNGNTATSRSSTGPLMSLANFSFSSWARKLSDSSQLNNHNISEHTSQIPSDRMTTSNSDNQPVLLSPPDILSSPDILSPPISMDHEPSSTVKSSFAFRSLFRYSNSNSDLYFKDRNEKLSPSIISPLSSSSTTSTSTTTTDLASSSTSSSSFLLDNVCSQNT